MAKVKLKGRGVSEETARAIIARAKRAKSKRNCPYRKNWVQWSIWMTAFNYKSATNDQIYVALINAGVPCDQSDNSSTDYPDLLPQRNSRYRKVI